MKQTIQSQFQFNSPMGLFDKKGELKVDKLTRFMKVSREELASAFGFTGDQLRPDRIASRTKETLTELAGAIEYVANVFSGNESKTRQWFNLPNVHFGGGSPKSIIMQGRFRKIKNFIYSSQKQ